MPSQGTTTLDAAEFHKAYRSNMRQQTRAILGIGVSTVLMPVLPYMILPAGAATYGLKKSRENHHKLKELANSGTGYRLRKRDATAGFVGGYAEKLAMSFLLLGHDEMELITKDYELDPAILEAHNDVLAIGPIGELNAAAQVPIETAQVAQEIPTAGQREEWFPLIEDYSGWHGSAEQIAGDILVTGAVAAVVEDVVNRPLTYKDQMREKNGLNNSQNTGGPSK